jgi:hypothetical protein
MRALIKILKKSLKRVFLENSQKSAILTKNGQKSIFFPKKISIPFEKLAHCVMYRNLLP